MPFTFDPVVADHWELTHNSFRSVQQSPNSERGYIPIPPADLPELFTAPVIAVGVGNIHARAHWWLGCCLFQQVEIAGSSAFQSERLSVPINRPPTILSIPLIVPSYRLYLEIPYWHLEVSLSIWQYRAQV